MTKEFQLQQAEQLLAFIDQSPTAFHAVQSCVERLRQEGFVALPETEKWNLEAGRGYYLTRNGSAIIAFRIPKQAPRSFMICASHTDSPMFKLKGAAISEAFGTYQRLNTEGYGGTILSTWLDRPLTLAGRVILREGSDFYTKNIFIDRDLILIPNTAIHLNRSINNGYVYNPAQDMLPLFSQSCADKGSLHALLAKELGCSPDTIVGMDLYVVCHTKGSIWGADQEFISAPHIDNLMCVWGSLEGFCQAELDTDCITMFYAADNEEVGSATKQGAGSPMLSDSIDRICEVFGTDRRCMLATSMMVSADNGHAKHPNQPQLSDAANAPRLNGGVVIKSNAAQKYTTDGISAALFAEICRRAEIEVQSYANRSDMAGGSTLGSISNTQVPLITVDIGMAQLAMHSAYETAGSADAANLLLAMKAFFESSLQTECDGSYRLNYIMGE